MYDSELSQNFALDNAFQKWKTPSQSVPLHETKPHFRVYTPHIHEESFGDTSIALFEQPLLSTFKPTVDTFAMNSFSSLPNVSLLQTITNVEKSIIERNTNIVNASLLPFFGSRLRQDMSGTKMDNDYRPNSRQFSSLFTGSNDFMFDKKPDTPDSFFDPPESRERQILTSSGRGGESTQFMHIDIDRYRTDITKRDDCFERIPVGRSLTKDPHVPASDGYHGMYRFIDADRERNYSYGKQMLEPLLSMDVPTAPILKRPDTSSMPQSSIVATKPRIYDGAIDQENRFSFITTSSVKKETSLPVSTKNQETNHKFVVQKDLGNEFLSSSFVPPRSVSTPQGNINMIEEFTDTVQPRKRSWSIPLIKGQSLRHPMDDHIAQTTKRVPDRGSVVPESIIGSKSIVASNTDISAQHNKSTRRSTGSVDSMNTVIPKCNTLLDQIQSSVNPTKRVQLRNISEHDTYHPQRTFETIPYTESTRSVLKKEVPIKGVSEVKKVVRFALTDTTEQCNEPKKTRRQMEYPQGNSNSRVWKFQQDDIPKQMSSLQKELRFIEFDYEWPKYLEPKTKKKDFVLNDLRNLRDTKRVSNMSNTATLDSTNTIGVRKPLSTMGQTMDRIGTSIETLSLKKEEKGWPINDKKSAIHIAAPSNDSMLSKLTRSTVRTTDHEYTNDTYIPSYEFPVLNTESTKTSRRPKYDSSVHSPNPNPRNTTQSQTSFYQNIATSNRATNSPFAPIPSMPPVTASKDGIQSTIRI